MWQFKEENKQFEDSGSRKLTDYIAKSDEITEETTPLELADIISRKIQNLIKTQLGEPKLS